LPIEQTFSVFTVSDYLALSMMTPYFGVVSIDWVLHLCWWHDILVNKNSSLCGQVKCAGPRPRPV